MKLSEESYFTKFKTFLSNEKLIPEEESTIIIGLSGGVDSVCLFHLFLALREEKRYSLKLICHHFNHHIRHESAKADEDFVRNLCKAYDVPLIVDSENVPAYASKHKLNLEAAGRQLRYMSWNKIREELLSDTSTVRIATGHHQSDVVESFLMHIERGSGLHGLASIQSKREFYIRPLLCFSKTDLYQMATENTWAWVEDETNQDDSYTRNFMRNKLLKLWQDNADPGLENRMMDTIYEMQNLSTYIQNIASEKLSEIECEGYIFPQDDRNHYSCEEFIQVDPFMQNYVLIEIFRKEKLLHNLTREHIEAVINILNNKEGEKKFHLPGNKMLYKTNAFFCFFPTNIDFNEYFSFDVSIEPIPCPTSLWAGEHFLIPNTSWSIHFHSEERIEELLALAVKEDITKIQVRHYKNSDYYLTKENRKIPIKEYFGMQSIPIDIRPQYLLLCLDNRIISMPKLINLGKIGEPVLNSKNIVNYPTDEYFIVWYNSQNKQ